MMKPMHLLGTSAAMAALLIFAAAEAAEAQRGGGRGGGGRSGASAGSANRQVRSSSGSTMRSASRQTSNVNRTASASRSNVNRSAANVNRSGNRVNTGNINTGDVNIDVDNGCCDGGWGDNYHPVARGAAIAATTAVVMGAYYNSLPGGCVTVVRGGHQLLAVRIELVPAGLFRRRTCNIWWCRRPRRRPALPQLSAPRLRPVVGQELR